MTLKMHDVSTLIASRGRLYAIRPARSVIRVGVAWAGLLLTGCGSMQGGGRSPYLLVNRTPGMAQAAASAPTPVSQAGATDCRPYDSSMVCCIKKFPLSPMESCAASPQEIFETLNGVKMAMDEGEFANNAGLPEWKQRCIKGFVNCVDRKWTGSCYECLRRCEGQHEWPGAMCGPGKSKGR